MKSIADIVDLEELREKIDVSIEELKLQIKNKDLSLEESSVLLNKLLEEREYLLDDYDEIKNIYWRGFPFSNWIDPNKISIRLTNVSFQFKSDLQEMASTLNVSKGYLLNELIKFTNENLSENISALPDLTSKGFLRYMNLDLPSASISHRTKLTILNQDFEEIETRFNFNHIKKLDLSDVKLDKFQRYVKSINHCNVVILSDTIPKLIAYAKLSFCSEIRFMKTE